MWLSRGDVVHLHGGPYTAAVAPAAGGRITSLRWSAAGTTRPLLVEWDGQGFPEHDWPKAGAFPMVPFANRLAPEGLEFGGRSVRPLAGPAGFAVHGIAHRRAWSLLERSTDRAVLGIEQAPGGEGWPWAWRATQEIRLDEQGIEVAVTVANESAEAMPLTIGWHPYLATHRGAQAADLWHDAAARFELDERGAASGEPRAASFGMRPGETAAFAPWPGHLSLRLRGDGLVRVTCQAGGALVLHRPAIGEYLCAEPVTSVPGQITALPAGAQRTLVWRCAYEPAAAAQSEPSPKTSLHA